MKVDISKINVSERIRKDYGDIPGLAYSIKRDGLFEPIIVEKTGKDRYELLAGHRRLLAHIHLERKTITVTVYKTK